MPNPLPLAPCLSTHPRTHPYHYRNNWARTRFPSASPSPSPFLSPTPSLPYNPNETIDFHDADDIYTLPWDYYHTWNDFREFLSELGYDPALLEERPWVLEVRGTSGGRGWDEEAVVWPERWEVLVSFGWALRLVVREEGWCLE